MTDGEDVRQLERNLRALGYDPRRRRRRLGLGDHGRAVERFQDAPRTSTEDGTLTRGEVVFRAGPTRIGEAKATVGQTGRARAARSASCPRRGA